MKQPNEKELQSDKIYSVALLRYLKFRSGKTLTQTVSAIKEIAPDIKVSEPTLHRLLKRGRCRDDNVVKAFIEAVGGDWDFIARRGLSGEFPESDFHLAVRSGGGSESGVAKARRSVARTAGQKSRRALATT